jgi:hypothetical protein
LNVPKVIVGVERCSEGKPLLEPRLWGTWRSDRKKTFERRLLLSTPEKQRKFRSLFGRLTVTWKRSTVSTYFAGKRFWGSPNDETPETCRYTVLARSDSQVVVLFHEKATPQEKSLGMIDSESMMFIEFDESGYWLTVNSGFCEYFRKMTPKAKPGRGTK